MENRSFARAKLNAKATVYRNNETFEGEVTNLSLSGTFVTSVSTLERNDLVTVTIYHPLTRQNLSKVKAKVARVTDMGVGLHFEKPLIL
jgi:tRNA (Thr-GGU) A37 N-methylase